MVYLDNAASTRPDDDAIAAVAHALGATYANPSSAHAPGAEAARALEDARTGVAALVSGAPAEVIFTSGGTEANALGVFGAARTMRGRHAIASAIEHPSVLRNLERLRDDEGWTLTLVQPTTAGVVAIEAFAHALREDTALVALMLANNEVGTLQPVAEVAHVVRARAPRAHVHVDAVQALGFGGVNARALGVDSLALSGHKLHGPKGVGALWLRAGARVEPLWDGGRQERGLRSGTENVAAIVGLACAAARARDARAEGARVARLRDDLESAILAAVPDARPTVPPTAARVPFITSVTLPGLPAEPLLHALGARGIIASAGSACASRDKGPSHTLRAMGVGDNDAVLRFSLSRFSTADELTLVAPALRAAVDEVSAMATVGRARPRRAGAR